DSRASLLEYQKVFSEWKQTFSEMGKPEWFDEYMLIDEKTGERFDPLRPGVRKMKRRDVSDEIPHVETAYGESAPAEAFAETIAALFAHDGKDKDLVSDGMEKLVADLLGLDRDKDIREQFTPARITRQVVPDGFASRGQVAVINEERDAKFGEITDPYEIGVQALGNELSDDTPFGNEIRTLESWLEEHGDKPRMENTAKWVKSVTNITEASEEDAAFVVQVLLDNPGLVDMIRRHGVAPIYFSESDLNLSGMEVRGVHFGFGIPDSEAEVINTPRVVMDLHDATPWKGTPDVPTPPLSREKMKEWRKVTVFDNVTRTHVGNSNEAVLRHEIGHSIHDRLLERAMRGEITGRRAQLIRAYSKSTWEEFYKELGRPDLWEEHQRALRATHILGYPGETKPSEELPWVDSAYAYTNPREMFAEVFTAYTSSDPAFRSLIGDVALEHMQAMSGDSDTIPEPPPLLDAESPDFPEPPPMDGFA
ncbi:MAG: hypothetical protein EBX09_07775, partial [Actinobacteria bacterium]|nr:hypothetical protein [Actinomycetota bacterium]